MNLGLPYFPMYPSDFEAKTSHLTLIEDGAYNRLLRLCWMTPGCSLPEDEAWIMRRVRAHSDEEKEAVRVVLGEFFTIENGRYSNARLRQEWQAAEVAYAKRKNAGSKGGKSKSLKNKGLASSNATAMLKQPEPEPEPYKSLKLTDSSVPKGTGEIADFHKRAIFSNGVRFLASHGRSEADARKIIGRWLKGNSAEAVFKAFADAKDASAVDPVSYIGRLLVGRENERLKGHGIEVGGGDTRKRRNISPGPEWDTKVDLSGMQPSAETDQQACEVHVGDIPEEWNRLELSSLRTQGG